jgi:hypothetical protein
LLHSTSLSVLENAIFGSAFMNSPVALRELGTPPPWPQRHSGAAVEHQQAGLAKQLVHPSTGGGHPAAAPRRPSPWSRRGGRRAVERIDM